MAWKGVHLTQPARLSLARSQLCVTQDDGDTTIPLEDIAWIVVDNHRTTLSVSLLAACAEHGVAIIGSDSRHMPSSLTLPLNTHHRTAAIARLQLDAGLPLKKRLWQSIVRAKIVNQAATLDRAGVRDPPPLGKMTAHVRSGDPDNLEARAAREYWAALFADFTRADQSDLRNKALNYGYAVLRGCVARALTAAGFLPAVGLHHSSLTNPFNLADDMIEPFRPIADLAIHAHLKNRDSTDDLSLEDRQVLATLPLHEALVGDDTLMTLNACDLVAQSLVRALETKDPTYLTLPAIPPLQTSFSDL